MNEAALKRLWQDAGTKTEQAVTASRELVTDIQLLKVYTFLDGMKPTKKLLLAAGILWAGTGIAILGPIYLHAFASANKFFLFSMSFQVLVTAIAVLLYGYQLIRIYQVDITGPVIATQQKLAQLQVSTLWSARILCLQLPAWTTFWWQEAMIQEWQPYQWLITLSITFCFTWAALWLFRNIRYENRNKRWFRMLFKGREWTPLLRSMALLEEVQQEAD